MAEIWKRMQEERKGGALIEVSRLSFASKDVVVVVIVGEESVCLQIVITISIKGRLNHYSYCCSNRRPFL